MTPTVTATPTITPTPRSTVETRYEYDRNGNLIRETVRRPGPDLVTRYYYDYENRLRRVAPPTGPAINYRYDYAGNLVERRVDIYRGDVVRYVYGAGVEPLAQQEGGQWTDNVVVNGKIIETFRRAYGNNPNNKLFYHTDALGSVVALSNRNGRVTRTTEYDQWGKVLTDNFATGPDVGGPVSVAYEFIGGYGVRRDVDGKSIMGVRMYDAGVGRFTTEDPLGWKVDLNLFRYVESVGKASINTYEYAKNNPLRYIDPSGLASFPCARARAAEAYALAEASGLPGLHNGPGDAFRHCYWMCETTKKCGFAEALIAGTCHEFEDPNQPGDERRMDWYNNAVGRTLGLGGPPCDDGSYCSRACKGGIINNTLRWLDPGRW
jgi:RHS repeat-associated protein